MPAPSAADYSLMLMRRTAPKASLAAWKRSSEVKPDNASFLPDANTMGPAELTMKAAFPICLPLPFSVGDFLCEHLGFGPR